MLEDILTSFDTSTVPDLGTPLTRSLTPIRLCVGPSPLCEEYWQQAATYISHVYPNARFDIDVQRKDAQTWRNVSQAVAEARTNRGANPK
ncbi:uncharacterized protein PHACADRAFT_254736 [Phanerochaete carnosa HHB-10118-sp]|uniref:Uncharacterized protein n=1 Tax=Phanerochaete carnosa (strain HHB-10118-sp) TaxID=650164 RepID=K5VZY9_PHACS|nr:uncharacterized protein PHACADRAFT_254736 [Phanerochaete carnosa HHB-10118-sp]EKM57158.1 hypothetical protein PHACADRAFT_254736 [Phanerochaete carnosa HHB-10118-sp]